MSSTNKSSKDILNELFSSFNTSFDENAVEEAEESNKGGSKKRKKSKKTKKSKKKDKKGDDSDDNSSGGGDDDEKIQEEPSHKKTHHRKHRHGKDKQNGDSEAQLQHSDGKKVSKKRRRTEEDQGAVDGDDVDTLIQKHRHKVKRQFKGLVSNIGDIVINNDELIKSKSRKREDDIRRASGQQPLPDVEDGEILDEKDDFFGKKHHKSKKLKISASQAYKLDMEEKMLLGIEPPVSSHKKAPKEDGHEVKRSKHSSSSDKRRDSLEGSSSRDGGSSHQRRKSGDNSESSSRSRVVRQAPARTPTPPPPEDYHVSSSSRRSSSYNYKDTKWQKEQNHYESQQSYSRRRDYDAGNYYEKETTRRSDGRSGFGFDERSYYDNPVDRGDRRHGHYQHDERNRRERSRSPRDSRRRSRSPPRWRRSRSRSSERRRHPDDIIDKAKLLEIARKNAAKLMRRGVLPSDIFSRDQIMAIRAGGKSVEELTDYCKRIAKRDANGVAISDDDSGDDADADHFLHHPFQVKDRPLPQITLNIRNAVPIPIRTPQVLAIESAKLKVTFPVSSGTQHRIKELEWHPVDKEEEEKKKAAEAACTSLVPLDGPKVNTVSPMVRDQSGGEETVTTVALLNTPSTEKSDKEKKASPPPQHTISLEQPQVPNFDISDVIAIRLKAMRQLSENPKSDDAKKQLEDATQMMKKWADSKALEPKFLTQSELTQGPQAWAKRDQLVKAKEVQSPMGLHLLQKMGWRPGDGLGKTKSGDIQPLALEVKTDKKGLTSVLDLKKGPAMPLVYDLSGKHPISALMELCAKRKWGAPDFDLVFEHGPAHKKQFVYKVVVNGVEYQPCVAVNNKKMAKTNAAAFCLQSLGLLPTAAPVSSSETLQTVAPDPVPPPPPLAAGFNNNNTGMPRFTPAHYLQTVPSTSAPAHQLPLYPHQQQPPLPPELLMPPPPPPPPTK